MNFLKIYIKSYHFGNVNITKSKFVHYKQEIIWLNQLGFKTLPPWLIYFNFNINYSIGLYVYWSVSILKISPQRKAKESVKRTSSLGSYWAQRTSSFKKRVLTWKLFELLNIYSCLFLLLVRLNYYFQQILVL